MRAPFCSEATDLCPDDRDIIGSESENENEIHAIERTLERSRVNKTAVFGISLNDLMGTTPQVVPQIPFILSRLCSFIEIHGMHQKRLFSEGEEKNIVETLRTEFTECGDAPLESTGHVASVAKLLIIFFEELPEPLIPASSQPDFIKDMEKLSLNSDDCFSSLKMSLEKLPDSIYQVLKYLSRFLLRITFHKEYNGLTSDNLALIFGPLIFRPSTNDKKMILVFQNIMNHFVKDYHALFENSKNNHEIVHHTDIVQSPVSFSKRQPCPSSVMPVMSLSPLSVVIPAVEDNVIVENKNSNVPILLIDGHLNTNSKNINDSWNNKYKYSKDGVGIAITRKRKERRFSGEDVQQRSSSEERPSPNSFIDDNLDIMRRCNSHEEVTESEAQITEKFLLFKAKKRDDSQFADSYATNGIKISERYLSPHPPNAKRREVEINDELDLDISWSPSIMLEEDTIAQPDLQCNKAQNSIAETANQNTMDCDTLDEEEIAEENHQNWKSDIPRSASCPVPNTDAKNTVDSESNNLSLSWSMLFEDSEPVRAAPHLFLSKESDEETLLSPSVQNLRKSNYYEAPLSPSAYRSYLSYRSTHLDPSVPPSPPVEQEDFAKKLVESNSVSDSMKHLTKKIHGIKKRIRKYDEKFEAEFGFKPSHADKSNNHEAKKLMNDLYKARKELKALKEEAHLDHVSPASWHATRFPHILGDSTNHFPHEINKDKSKASVEDLFDSTMKTLEDDRKSANRPDSVDDMTKEQVQDEKIAIQRALLNLEKIQGKPITREQRTTCRPLYDRYRSVKKLLVRSGSFPGTTTKTKELCSDLQPILEHVTMDFPLRHQKTDMEKQKEVKEPEIQNLKMKLTNFEEKTLKDESKDAYSNFLATKYDNSNLHELPLSEMIFQMQKVKDEKRNLRKLLKEFETEFFKVHGRKVQKEDRASLDSYYNEYKHVKARLRLLEALISKHDQHQLM